MSLTDVLISGGVLLVFGYVMYLGLKKKHPGISAYFPFLEKKTEVPVIPSPGVSKQTWIEKRQIL